MKAIVLLSGGLDSTTCLGAALAEGYQVYPLTFDYGQRHFKEITAMADIIKFYHLQNPYVVKIANVGGSALTDAAIEVPDYQPTEEIPVTYVPARNLIFLSYAAAYGEVVGAERIFIGVNAVDYSGYPDCRPEFIRAFTAALAVGTKSGVSNQALKIETPLINLSKAEIIRLATKLKAPLHLTTSCYRGGAQACGWCDSCVLRLKGFREAGLTDPISYVSNS